jgi:hypothetical protein
MLKKNKPIIFIFLCLVMIKNVPARNNIHIFLKTFSDKKILLSLILGTILITKSSELKGALSLAFRDIQKNF